MHLEEHQRSEIEQARAAQSSTRRSTVPAMEEVLHTPLPVLDKGFVRVVDYMGDDAAIVQAARVSYGKGTRHTSSDAGLIDYLMRHRHTSPFEMCEIKLHIKLPIFVARQWVRHRTASINEYSARYSVLDEGAYVPRTADVASQSTNNRQGRGTAFDDAEAANAVERIERNVARALEDYHWLLNDAGAAPADEADEPRPGLSRELARIVLPLASYTQWYWKTDLHNLFHFIALRADPHAQLEIRAYAECLLEIVRRWVPLACAAFENHALGGARISGKALSVLRRMLAGESVDRQSSGMSPREWQELQALLGSENDERGT